jgi:hypothetical protein
MKQLVKMVKMKTPSFLPILLSNGDENDQSESAKYAANSSNSAISQADFSANTAMLMS